MDIFSASRFIRSRPLVAYLVGILSAVLAVWVRYIAGTALFGFPFITFFAAVVLASLFAGVGPGLVTVVLSTLLSTIVLPAMGLVNAATLSTLAIGIFVVTCLLLVLLMRFVVRAVEARDEARDELRRVVADLDQAAIRRTEALRIEQEERQRAEQQLRQMQKIESIGQLTGGIAHDFNNMLAVVMGSLDLARRRLADRAVEPADAYVVRALDGAKKAAELTSRLLAFARQQPLSPKAVDPNTLVSQMSDLLRRTLGERIQVQCALAPEAWLILIDAPQLESAIVNLAINARDAMRDEGKLTIEIQNVDLDLSYSGKNEFVSPGDYLLIGITDNGSGMSRDVIDRAFEPFFTTKGVGKGTGLGLSQVYGFVKQSGGHLKIYSELGVGTSVKIYLPRYRGELSDATGLDEDIRQLPRARSGTTVLLVEDDECVRSTAAAALADLGYEVIERSNGRDALQLIAGDHRIDLLLTDVVMPEMTGRQLADRACVRRPELRVLYTTGYTRNAIVHNGVLDADVAFLAKPYTLRQLALKVASALSTKPDSTPN